MIGNIERMDIRYYGGRQALVVRPPCYVWRGIHIEPVPRQEHGMEWLFLTDGGTIPRPLWSIYNPWGIYLPAYILHDTVWSLSDLRRDVGFAGSNEMLADAIRDIGEHLSINTSTDARVISGAVSMFGKPIWTHGAKYADDLFYHYRIKSA